MKNAITIELQMKRCEKPKKLTHTYRITCSSEIHTQNEYYKDGKETRRRKRWIKEKFKLILAKQS